MILNKKEQIQCINNLSITELPSNLLKLLSNAKTSFHQGNLIRSHILITLIERECVRQSIEIILSHSTLRIYNPDGKKRKSILSRLIKKINYHLESH